MSGIPNFTYKVIKLKEGYMGKCLVNPEISVYAKSRQDVDKKMEIVAKEFTEVFPHRKPIILRSHKDIHILSK
jgi:hypothetical protein